MRALRAQPQKDTGVMVSFLDGGGGSGGGGDGGGDGARGCGGASGVIEYRKQVKMWYNIYIFIYLFNGQKHVHTESWKRSFPSTIESSLLDSGRAQRFLLRNKECSFYKSEP